MFVNLSNHPVEKWDKRQVAAAEQYGKIIEIPFPMVSPEDMESDIILLGEKYLDLIKKEAAKGSAVMVQGEFTLTYQLVVRLKQEGYIPVAACSERIVEETGIHSAYQKIVSFRFVKFRKY